MEVVVGSSGDYNIYCIRGLNGTQKWAFPTGGTLRSAPAIDDVDGDDQIEILVCSGDHNLYCLRGTDGVQKWAFPTGGALYSSPVIADVDGDGLKEVLIGALDGSLYCLRGSDGTQKWASPISSTTSSPVVADVDRDGNTDIIIGSQSYRVYCLRGSNGTVEWSFPTPTTIHLPGALVDADGDGRLEFLVSQAAGSTLYCLNAENGSVAWQIDLANDIHSPFAGDIDGDGCSEIIVGTQDPDAQGYRVFAIDDPWNSSGCGTLELGETDRGEDFDFRVLGRVLRLFMPQQAQVSLRIYDAQGRLIQRVYEGVLKPGTYTFIPELEAEGVYLAVLRYREGMKTLRIVK
jgi:outer membrane protein assembly factor BamB